MKGIRPLAAAAVFLFCFHPRPVSAAEEIEVVRSGKYYGKVEAYRAGDQFYLGAKQAARIYKGSLQWYSARGMIQLSFRGRQIRFRAGSSRVNVHGKLMDMPRPMIVRTGRAFIPVEFFSSPEFAALVGKKTEFNPGTRLLLVDHKSNVGPLRWFSYSDHTRIVLELDESLRYQTSRRGRRGLGVSIPSGVIGPPEKIDVGDGVVDDIRLTQKRRHAYLSVKLQKGAGAYRLREFKDPRRIVIDVPRSGAAAAANAKRARRVSMEAPPPPRRRGFFRRAAPRKDAARGEAEAPVVVKEAVPTETAAPAPKRRGRYRIAIDAGHGGKDGGAVGRRGTLEKDMVLSMALELAKLLEQEDEFDVLMTRRSDEFVKLGDRAKKANDAEADLFVSIHCNAHSDHGFAGYEIYFLSERASDPEAERLAEFENSVLEMEGRSEPAEDAKELLISLARTEFMNDAAELAGLMARSLSKRVDMRNRGVRQADFYVLRGVHAPAVLAEMGFLSNSKDEAKLQSPKYRRKIVEGLYAGIVSYARRKHWLPRGGSR